MRKLLIVCLTIALMIGAGNAFATCNGGPECSAEGNFAINTFAAGGGLSADGELIPNGAAGGIGVAGGIGIGQAKGVILFGKTAGELKSTGGGMTKTEAYEFNKNGDPRYDISIGNGSYTENYASTGGYMDIEAKGFAATEGSVLGAAGQASLNGSVVFGSPLNVWDSHGFSGAVAGQGSVGGFIGGGIVAGYGDATVDAGIDMHGYTEADSYRAIDFFPGGKTEYLVSYGYAETNVNSLGRADDSYIGIADVEGGYIAAGGVATKTAQIADGGLATAKAVGTYSGSGELNCNFNGRAEGFSKTSATTLNGFNGSIMTSSAGMQVSTNHSNDN